MSRPIRSSVLRAALAALALSLCVPSVHAGGNGEVLCAAPIVATPSCQQNQIVDIAWSPLALPVRWWMNQDGARNNSNHGGVTLNAAAVLAELNAAFEGWETIPESAVAFQSMGMTPDVTTGLDDNNMVIWSDTGLGTSTLAITAWTVLTVDLVVSAAYRDLNGDGFEDLNRTIYPDGALLRAGTILDADITMNSGAFDWSLTPNPTPDICDIRAVALHEAGHAQGLSHSAVLREPATMFAFFDTTSVAQQSAARSLEWDDIAASARAYPVAGVGPTGSISGRLVRSNNTGLVGAQISAIDTKTGRVVEGVFTNSDSKVGGGGDGAYRLDRLPAGTYYISVDYLRRNGHLPSGWRWLNNERSGYNVTVGQANIDPVDVGPELLSSTEGTADDLNPPLLITLAANEQRTLPNLTANTAYPAALAGTTQLLLSDIGVVNNIPIAFPFSFYGVPYTEFAAYANGHLTFGLDLELAFDESGASFYDYPRVAGLLRDLDPGADGTTNGGPDAYVRRGASMVETIWLSVSEKVPAPETGSTLPTPYGANTFTIGFNSAGKIWIDYQRLSSPFGIAGIAAGDGSTGVREKYDFGRPRLMFADRPTLENAVPLSGVRVEFTPHALGGYVASSPQWTAPEAAPPGGVGGLVAEGTELTQLSWPPAGVARYHVYRGRLEDLRASGAYTVADSCWFAAEEPLAYDAEGPARGRVFYYLVTAVREFGIEGTLGRNSAGVARTNAVPCGVQ